MDKDDHNYYIKLKNESYNDAFGSNVKGSWFKDYLEKTPSESQFKEMVFGLNMNAEFWWAIWSAKK